MRVTYWRMMSCGSRFSFVSSEFVPKLHDWVSGEKLWLLDVIAPNRKLATAVLANFSQVAQDKPVSIHPIVARSVEPELLEKMTVKEA